MRVLTLGIILTFVGFLIVFLGAVLESTPSNFAGAVIIGPFPILFGSGARSIFGPFLWVFAIISVVLIILYVVSIINFLRTRKGGPGGI